MKDRLMHYFSNVAMLTAKLSTCQSRQVGAVLVKDDRIVAIGYNGTVSGAMHCDDMTFKGRNDHHEWSRYNELHAEQNLLMYCAKNGIITQNCGLFITLGPCIDCAKIIIVSGIKKVYISGTDYDKESGIRFLEDNDIGIIRD